MYKLAKKHSVHAKYKDLPWMLYDNKRLVIPATVLDKKRGLTNGATAKLWYKYRDEAGYDIDEDVWTEKNKAQVQLIKEILRLFYGNNMIVFICLFFMHVYFVVRS
jgi:hypothetical protein